MSIKFIVTMLITLCGISVASDTLIIRGTTDYKPFFSCDSKGRWSGIEIDVLTAILTRAGLPFKMVDLPFARGMADMKSGQCSAMLALSKTEERAAWIDFIGISRFEQMHLIVTRPDSSLSVKSLDDILRLKNGIGIQTGLFYQNLSDRIAHDTSFAAHIEYSNSSAQLIEMTLRGRLTGFIEEGQYMASKIQTDPTCKNLRVHSFALSKPEPVYIGFSMKVDPTVRARIHTAYNGLYKEGEIQKIWEQWDQKLLRHK